MFNLVFIKWGGSLITDKDTPLQARHTIIKELANHLALLRLEFADTRFILGHGSGSFGHSVAQRYHTRDGVSTQEEWNGFWKVYKAAHTLNQIVLDALENNNIPYVSFPPSATFTTANQAPEEFFWAPFLQTLQANILPVVFGDVVFDRILGGTILSTEDVFLHLAHRLKPERILLAGIVSAVYADFPQNNLRIATITPTNFHEIQENLRGSASTDVTGGMLAKVRTMLKLVEEIPTLKVKIFSGEHQENFTKALHEEDIGTTIEKE